MERANPSQDHSRILRAAINRPPTDWRRRAGRLIRRTWLRTIELDLRPHNIGLNTAWMRAQDRPKWRQLVETAMLTDGRAIRNDDDDDDDDDVQWNSKLVMDCEIK